VKFLDLDEITPEDANICCQKAMQLKRMFDSKLNVPKFFVITKEFFDAVVEFNELTTEFGFLHKRLSGEGNKEVTQKLTHLIAKLKFPEPLLDALYKRYLKLSHESKDVKSAFDLIKKDKEGLVAVRCSDPNPYLDTYTCIRGKDELVKAIRLCWRSHYTSRALDYRFKHGLADNLALIVQKMVITEKAVQVTQLDSNVFEVRTYWGQTGFLTQVNPDVYIVNAENQISSRKIGNQVVMFVLDSKSESFKKKEVPAQARHQPVLEDFEVLKSLQIAKQVMSLLGKVSVELGISEGEAYVINAREIVGQKQAYPKEQGAASYQPQAEEPVTTSQESELTDITADDLLKQAEQEEIATGMPLDMTREPPTPTEQQTERPAMEPIPHQPEEFFSHQQEPATKNFFEEQAPQPSPIVQQNIPEKLGEPSNIGEEAKSQTTTGVSPEQIEEIFQRYITINPSLKEVLELLKQDIIKILR